MKKKNTDIKFVIQKCFVLYNNLHYTINLNYKIPIPKELSHIIIRNLKKNKKRIFLHDIKIINNTIVSAKESTEKSGCLIEIEKILISNKYYNIEKYITPEELKNYSISGLNNKENREHFYLLNYNELISFNNSIYPVYMIHNKYIFNIPDIINTHLLVKPLKKVIIINSYAQLKNCKYNFHFNNMEFHLDLKNAERKNKYYQLLYNNDINRIKNKLINLYEYLKLNSIKTKKLFKDTIIDNIEILENKKNYYLNISGFKIINNKCYISSIKNNSNIIIKVKKNNNNFYWNNKKIDKELIDNCNITLHETIEQAKECNYIKLNYLKKFLKEI